MVDPRPQRLRLTPVLVFLPSQGCSDTTSTPVNPDASDATSDSDALVSPGPDASDALGGDVGDSAPWDGPSELLELVQYVDPRIGTGNSGKVAVGAAVPHGWVRLGPDMVNEPLDIAAYRFGATEIEGFTHTQFSGAGGSSTTRWPRGPAATSSSGRRTATALSAGCPTSVTRHKPPG